MRDDPSKTTQDRKRINLHQDYEIDYWAKELGVSRERLQRLVDEHGDRAEDVRRALAKQRV